MAKPQFESVLAHWAALIEDFQASSLDFYTAVEAALQRREVPDVHFSRVDYKESGVLSAKRVYFRVSRQHLLFDICAAPFGTGFFFSWWQVAPPLRFGILFGLILAAGELLVGRRSFVYFTHHAPYYFLGFWGDTLLALLVALLGFLFLCVLARLEGGLLENFILPIPIAGSIYRRLFRPATYYELDTTAMYRALVHAAVLEVVDGLTKAQGVRALADDDRKPIMWEIFRR